ncbi:MAG: EAL domain-containing protein [Halothiobacillaceae bacterium]
MTDLNTVRELAAPMRVLVVDDEPDALMLLASLLARLFGQVERARDGDEAMRRHAAAGPGHFDLLITDIQMPGTDGLTLIRNLRKTDQILRAVIVSAHNELNFFAESIDIGVDGFVIKPVQTRQFFEVLHRVVLAIHHRKLVASYQHQLEQIVAERTRALHHELAHDKLTGLLNMNQLQSRLAEGHAADLLLLNIDHFNAINAHYGYEVGDAVLVQVSQWIRAQLPEDFMLFRIGPDEFAALNQTSGESPALVTLAESLVRTFSAMEFQVDQLPFRITLTIGGAIGTGRELLRRAHSALNHARQIGRNRFAVHDEQVSRKEQHANNMHWMRVTRTALDRGGLVAHYQPIACNRTGQIVRHECLARIEHEGEMLPPARFMQALRLSGMMPTLTRGMIDQALTAFDGRDDAFTVNIAEEDFRDGYLVDYLRTCRDRHPSIVSRMGLEILEQVGTEGSDDVVAQLHALKEMGFSIILDDFGSERANFSRLASVPVDLIKIDGGFVRRIDQDPLMETIVDAIAGLARRFGAKVVAEYVHSAEVHHKIRELGIEYSQGFHIGRPAPQPVRITS